MVTVGPMGARGGPSVVVRLGREVLDGSVRELAASPWIYLGTDAERYFDIQRALAGHGRQIVAGPLLNEAADAFRDEILNFDQVLKVRSELRWQATDLAERSVYNTAFLHRCCSALVLHRVLAGLEEDLLVIVDDPFLGRRLAGLARQVGRSGDGPFRRAAHAVRHLADRNGLLVRGLVHRLLFLRAFRASRQTVRRHLPFDRPRPSLDVLIVTWLAPDTFDANAPIDRDTYFGLMPGELRRRGFRVGYLAILTTWVFPLKELLQNVASAYDHVAVPEEVLRWRDTLAIVSTTLLKPARVRRRLEAGGVDLTGHLVDELRREWAKPRQLWSLQFFYVGRFLAEHGAPAAVVHPFENQPWEKTLRLGLNERMPEVRVIGCQHTPISARWFPYFPSRRDLSMGQLPDRVVVIGPLWKQLLAAHGYPPEQLDVAPALRYVHLADLQPLRRDTIPRSGLTVVVAGSIGYSDSLEMVVKALRAIEPLENVRLVVKLHPKMGGTRDWFLQALLRALARETPLPHLTFDDRTVPEVLSGADVVLYTTTSVSYEALAVGIAVVFVQSDFWFDLDPVPADADVGWTVRTPAEIRAVIEGLLHEDPRTAEQRRGSGLKLLQEAFADGDAAGFVRALDGRLPDPVPLEI